MELVKTIKISKEFPGRIGWVVAVWFFDPEAPKDDFGDVLSFRTIDEVEGKPIEDMNRALEAIVILINKHLRGDA